MKLYSFFGTFCLLYSLSLSSMSLVTFTPNGGRFGDDLLNVTKMMYIAWRYKLPVVVPHCSHFDRLQLSEHAISSELYSSFNRRPIQHDSQVNRNAGGNSLFVSNFYMQYALLNKDDKDSIVHTMMFDRAFVEMMRFLIRPKSNDITSYVDKSTTSIGVHIRRGGDYDNPAFIAKEVIQFCPDHYYIDALEYALKQIGVNEPVNVYVFTDSLHPDKVVAMLQKHIQRNNVRFICKTADVDYKNAVLVDFFSMIDCDYLIRSKSAFSIMAEFLGNHTLVISPQYEDPGARTIKKIVTTYDYKQAEDASFVLMTSLYNETDAERLQEYLYCLKQNINHPLIETIHVVYDTTKDDSTNRLLQALQEAGVVIDYIEGRPSYEDCFEKARLHYPGKKILLANGDIFFNYTLFYLCDYRLDNTFVALTRWDVKKDGTIMPFLYRGNPVAVSQDVWAFESLLSPFDDASMQLGTQHCDGKIAFQAKKSGCNVINPCLSIQACHMHISDVRHYALEGEWTNAMAVRWSLL